MTDSRMLIETPVFKVSERRVGNIERFATVHHPGAVAIVAHDDEFVYLTRQDRPAVRKRVLELPAGTCEEGEEPIVTARRELEEEIGKWPREIYLLRTFYSSPGYTNEKIWLFRAHSLVDSKREPDPTEDIEVVRWDLNDLEMAIEEASTAKTIIGLSLLADIIGELARHRSPKVI